MIASTYLRPKLILGIVIGMLVLFMLWLCPDDPDAMPVEFEVPETGDAPVYDGANVCGVVDELGWIKFAKYVLAPGGLSLPPITWVCAGNISVVTVVEPAEADTVYVADWEVTGENEALNGDPVPVGLKNPVVLLVIVNAQLSIVAFVSFTQPVGAAACWNNIVVYKYSGSSFADATILEYPKPPEILLSLGIDIMNMLNKNLVLESKKNYLWIKQTIQRLLNWLFRVEQYHQAT